MATAGSKLTIRAKLLFMVILMNGLLLLAGAFVGARLYLVASGYENFRERTVQFSNVNAVADDLSVLRSRLNTGLRAGQYMAGRWPETAIVQTQNSLKSLHVRLELLEKNHAPSATELMRGIGGVVDATHYHLESLKQNPLAANDELERIADQRIPALSKQLTASIQHEISLVDISQAAITRGDIRALQYGLIGIGLALMAGLIISFSIFDTVIRPLGDTHRALLQVLSGNFRGLSLSTSQDEIGAIGRVIEDIKARSEHVHRLAYNDSPTGLPNRLQLVRDLADTARRAGEHRSYGLLLFAVDRFSVLNSSFGPRFGDEVIREIHTRLERLLNEGDRLYRYTGHMFACLIRPSVNDDEAQAHAVNLARRISEDFKNPLRAGELNLPLSLSIGVALSLQRARPDDMLAEAEAALVEAKRRGGTNTVIGIRDFADRTRNRLEIASAIRRGIDAAEFEPFFQPVVDVERGITVGAETLVRWRHADGRITLPGEFIFIAEESDLIRGITTLVVDKACMHLAQWKRDGHPVKLAFNVSARLINIGLKDIIIGAIQRSGVVPDDLEMEITETVLIGNKSDAEKLLLDLKQTGLRLSLDDFGTGYSSMSYLSRFEVDKIKIDSDFVKSLADGERQREVVSSIIQLARRLNIDVVAEGIETKEQMDLLQAMGCRLMQGWLFSAALPAPDYARWLKNTGVILDDIRKQHAARLLSA